MKTVEIDSFFSCAHLLDNIVLGIVKKVEKHPDADRLCVCAVDDGTQEMQVVCGGINLKSGMKVAFGKIGAKVKWHGQGDVVELKQTKIRGVESFGMICASSEIGLDKIFPQKDEREILDLSHVSQNAGTPISKIVNMEDTILEVDNKSMTHRPDLWGHYGIARELSAIYKLKLNDYSPKKIKNGNGVDIKISVDEDKLCPRYMAVAMEHIKVETSPEWMQNRLLSAGIRPINNIVDISNYVMLEIGQPMHAFDLDKLSPSKGRKKINVRKAKKGESIFALDGRKYDLNSDMLVIADDLKPVAVAGVVGGEETGVSQSTKTIIFESANFNPTSIRKTALSIGLRTESSARFEKSLDPNLADLGLRRAVELTLSICKNASVASKVYDVSNFSKKQQTIDVSYDFINKKIGDLVDKKIIIGILERLGFKTRSKKDYLIIEIPSWRATKDISIPEDIIEEIARMYGYEKIKTSMPLFPIAPPEQDVLNTTKRRIKNLLSNTCGANEVYNYSFVSGELLDKLGIKHDNFIELDNPISKERPLLRRNIFPGLIQDIERNMHRFERVKIFEVGSIYIIEEKGDKVSPGSRNFLPLQKNILSIAFCDKKNNRPFFEVANMIRAIAQEFGVFILFDKSFPKATYIHPGRSAYLKVSDQILGFITELHPQIGESLGIKERVAFAELDLNMLSEIQKNRINYKKIPAYPSVLRDIAFVVDRKVRQIDIRNEIKNIDSLVDDAYLFDVFSNPSTGATGKSMAFHIIYKSDSKTLGSNEVDKIESKIKEVLIKKFNATIR
jgi:phenylalanyl-tRNA synthetase beta chain